MSSRSILCRLLFTGSLVFSLTGANWPAFRGPNINGISQEKNVPLRWSDEENLLWKTKLPGPGGSSPIVWGNRVFVTCFTGQKAENLERHLLCFDRKTGKVRWQKSVPAKLPENDYTAQLRQHGFSTSTPVTDGNSVYVFYGRTGMLAYDFDGKERWRADLGKYVNGFGSGSSPTLYKNLVIVNATVESRKLVALDKTTGKVVWDKRLDGDSWSTPTIVEIEDAKQELVLNEQGKIFGFDPNTGEKLWECVSDKADYVSSTAVSRDGIVYIMGAGSLGRDFVAIRAGGRGDITKTRVLWRQSDAGASFCSPVLVGDRLYYFSRGATCLNAKTGEIVFQERLRGVGREYVSPVVVGDKIYVPTRYGGVSILQVGDKLNVVARNTLEGANFIASPAVSDGCLFLRSDEYLYCIGKATE